MRHRIRDAEGLARFVRPSGDEKDAIEALAELHRLGHPEGPWEPPILPAILDDHQEPVKIVPADAGVYGSDFARFVDK